MIIVQISVCLVLIAVLMRFIHRRKNKRFYQLLEQFPSHPTYPLIGNTHMLMGSFEGGLKRLEKIMQPYDRLVFWIGSQPCIFLKKHDDIATVLNQCQNRDTGGLVDGWLRKGILNAEYTEWKKVRKILAPGFHSDMLSKYVQVFDRNCSKLVEKLKPVADEGEQIDVFQLIEKTNLDTIAETTMGIRIRGKPGDDFCAGLFEGYTHGARRIQWSFLMNRVINMIYLKITGKFKVIDHIKYLPDEAIKNKLKSYHDTQDRSNTTDENNDAHLDSSNAVIDLLVKNITNEGSFTKTRMRDELLHLIVAGIDSPALTMSFLLLMLAMNQDVQQKVYEEITQFIADDETSSKTRLGDNFVYLEQCIKETLRAFGPGVVNGRRTHKEIVLKNNTIVPKNIFVATFTHLVNNDLDLYKNPWNWDPEHFSDEAVKQRPKTSQLSFGYGPRSCIAKRYAMMLLKTQIVHILREYRLSTDVKEFTKHHLIADLGTKSKIGYPIKFTHRREKRAVENKING